MSLMRWRPGTNLDRWDSFGSDIGNLRHEMDRLFSRLMVPGFEVGPDDTVFPSAELEEKDNAFILKLEVPGMKPEDIDIQVTHDAVMITGERKTEKETEEEGMTRSEFHYGKFSRRIALPAAIKAEEVGGDYKDGILILTMPKQTENTPKSVKVELKS